MDFNDKVKDSLRSLLGLSSPDEQASLTSTPSPTFNIGSKASSGIDPTLQAEASPAMESPSDIYKMYMSGSPLGASHISSMSVKYIPNLIIGSHNIENVLDEICKALDIQTVNNVSNTNLDKLRRMSAEHLAYFIVHESKKIVSGGGDATEELVEWLKSKPE